MNVTKSENISGLLVAIDFQKAFDSINWKFLENVCNPLVLDNHLSSGLKLFIVMSLVVL